MRKNAIDFNSYAHPIAVEASHIYDYVVSTIKSNRSEFNSIEIAVKEQFNSTNSGSRKRSRSTTPISTDTVGNSASVVKVDGFEQKVYLGDLQGPFGDQL